MGFIFEERTAESSYIETITQGYTEGDGSTIRPAEMHWHLVLVKRHGKVMPIFTGPLTTSGTVQFNEGVELIWIKFKLGTFMPHLPARKHLNTEMIFPTASNNSFWLKSATWQLPDYENVERFIHRLVRDEVLMHDPLIESALNGTGPNDMSPRTLRHRFLRATGLTQSYIHQMRRANYARSLLERGVSILDTVFEAGYFDQPHLTRSLKQFIGYTPAQIIATSLCRSIQDPDPAFSYDKSVLVR